MSKIASMALVGVIIGFMLFQAVTDHRNAELQKAFDGQLIQGMEQYVNE